MGVSGLWDILAPAGTPRSLAKLAIDAFESNTSDKRAYRVGIDASIWYKHAAYSREGENPELRLLFFRVKDLARLPLLPLFVFDGRCRPKVKRGSKMGKSGTHNLTRNMKLLLDVFGIEWREAAGEAEAELAFLNRVGVIDAIMTDDVDAFLFGAITIIRNPSLSLTGNRANPARNLDGKASKHHVMEFKAENLKSHPQIGMSQGGMIFFALLTGGDYDKGVDKIGPVTAHALVRCGFGDELYAAVQNRDRVSLHNFLTDWRRKINTELRENRRGFLKRASPGLCLPDSFPSLDLLSKYVTPARRERGVQGVWKNKELSLPRAASLCEKFFEWGTYTGIVKRFRSPLWEACIIRVLRRAALEQDTREADSLSESGMPYQRICHCQRPDSREAVGTSVSLISRYLNPEKVDHDADRISAAFVNKGSSASSRPKVIDDPRSFIVKIHSKRQHVSTDKSLEYRIEVDPAILVELTRLGIKGTRQDEFPRSAAADDWHAEFEGGESDDNADANRKARTAKAPPDPLSTFRMWCPEPMLRRVAPQLLEDYELAQIQKNQKTIRKGSGAQRTTFAKGNGKRKGKRQTAGSESESDTEMSADDVRNTQRPSPQKKKRNTHHQDAPSADFNAIPTSPNNDRLSRARLSRPLGNMGTASRALHPTINLNATSICATPISSQASTRTANTPQRVAVGYQASSSPFQSGQTASRLSHASGDDWGANDTASLFLFSIPNPCDPDLIDREDLRNQGSEPAFRWTDLSTGAARTYDHDDDNDFISGDDEMDRSFQQDFMRKAQETSKTYALRGKDATVDLNTRKPRASAYGRRSSGPTFIPKRVSSLSVATGAINTQSDEPSSSARHDLPLFLSSRSPFPAYLGHSRSMTHLSKSTAGDTDVIDVSSSDEDYNFPSSSSPSSSQQRGQKNTGAAFASWSQDSGIAMCVDDNPSGIS